MSEPSSASAAERYAPWVAGAVVALPILLAHYPPTADLPLHEAVVGFLRHWGDPKLAPPTIYQLHLGLPNQLFYFLILALSYVSTVTIATKLVLALSVFLLPPATAHVADHMGVTRWPSLLVAPIALGWMFFWGLLANQLGLDLYLFTLPLLDRFCQGPTWRRCAAVCGFVVLCDFTHEVFALTMGGTLALFAICMWRGPWKDNVLRVVPTVLVLALAATAHLFGSKIQSSYHAGYAETGWYPVLYKVFALPGVLYAGYEMWVRTLIFLVCLVPVILFGIERYKARTPRPWSLKERLFEWRYELLAASLFVGYLAAPVNIKGTTLIHHRFCAPAWILFTLAVCTRQRLASPWRLPRLLCALVPIMPILTSWERFVDSNRVYTDLDALVPAMEAGSTYIVLELGPGKPNSLYNPLTGGGHVVAQLGGRGFFDYTRSEASPVYERPEVQWNDSFVRMEKRSYTFIPAWDLRRYRYVLLHSSDDSISTVATIALQPEGRFIARAGTWTLVESTLPLVPIDAPDEPTPTPHPKSLRKRCLAVVEMIKKMPADEQALPPDMDLPLTPPP